MICAPFRSDQINTLFLHTRLKSTQLELHSETENLNDRVIIVVQLITKVCRVLCVFLFVCLFVRFFLL